MICYFLDPPGDGYSLFLFSIVATMKEPDPSPVQLVFFKALPYELHMFMCTVCQGCWCHSVAGGREWGILSFWRELVAPWSSCMAQEKT
jgi:hypothetical protein